MRLPRRVPWLSISELDQLCSWIYTDDSKSLAINRLSAWKAITPLPHALESTLALLVVIVHDNTHSRFSSLSLRQSYATALIRLVNGLVDPLQLGTYARSIASIATQLGLPSWLVELRHAATHEELPSLDLLREAARQVLELVALLDIPFTPFQSLSWLLHNYFLPMINPLSASPINQPPLRPLAPILKQYKNLMKIVTRDTSLTSRFKPEITTLMKAIERWVAEAGVAANVSIGELGWESYRPVGTDSAEFDVKMRWALERLCDGLLDKGVLVPLSKKKRTFLSDVFLPPKGSIALWASLLKYLQLLHGDFALVLCSRICFQLLDDNNPHDSFGDQDVHHFEYDPSYMTCLARWVKWAIDMWCSEPSLEYDLQREVILILMQGIRRALQDETKETPCALALLQTLCAGNIEMETAKTLLLRPASQTPVNEWQSADMAVMLRRLTSLHDLFPVEGLKGRQSRQDTHIAVLGWRCLNEDWQPCPIGVYNLN